MKARNFKTYFQIILPKPNISQNRRTFKHPSQPKWLHYIRKHISYLRINLSRHSQGLYIKKGKLI